MALAVLDFDKTLSSIETERRHVGAGKSGDVIVDTVFGGAARAAGVKALVAEMRREGAVVKVLYFFAKHMYYRGTPQAPGGQASARMCLRESQRHILAEA